MPSKSQFWRYGVAVLAVTIALIVKLFLATLIHQESPFMLFFIAIVASASYGGMTAGLVATALAAILCDYFFLAPKYLLLIANWEQGVRLAIFVLEATCICIAITLLNSARVRAQRSQVAALHCQAILLQSEERFRLLVEGVKDYAIFMLDANGIVASWNAGAARITGYKAREIIGQHYSRFYTYTDIEHGTPQQELQQAIAHEQLETEGWRLRRNGSQFWANVVTTSFKDSSGQIKGFSQIVRDMTERQRTEELLRQSEARLRLALAAAQIGTWDWNLSTQQLTWSAQQDILFDLAPGTFAGTYTDALNRVHPADRTSIETAIAHAIESTGTFNREFRILTTDGSIRWLSGQGKVFYDDAGRATQLTGINRDISEQKQTIAEIQAALQEKEVLLKELHHHVKNNLQAISNSFNLQSNYVSDRPTLEVLKASENRIFSMALVHELLYRSQDLAQINLAEYIVKLSAHLSSTACLNSHRVTFKIETEPIWIGSELAIPCGAIVNELVTHTLKRAFPNERSGQIHITLKSPDSHLIILEIGDNGIGLPLGFDWQNTELGLQTVTTLVNQIQGSIDFTNKEPGTEFTIIFTV